MCCNSPNRVDSGGKPSSILAGGQTLPYVADWSDLVFNTTLSSWSFDSVQSVVWIRTRPGVNQFTVKLAA